MSETGFKTTVKIFSLREHKEVILPNRDIPLWQESIMRIAALKLPAPLPEVPTACLMLLRSSLLEQPDPVPAPGAGPSQGDEFAARTIMVFANLREADFEIERDNFILVEATLQSFGCAVYKSKDMFIRDGEVARGHFKRYRGAVEPPSRNPRVHS